MYYFKLIAENGDIKGAEQFETLQFVRQLDNGGLIRSPEYNAQGIISCDQSSIYRLEGKVLAGDYLTAVEITGDEYSQIVPDPDADPDDDNPDEEIMTREQLTEKVKEQESTIQMLTDCILEMSEIIYG